MVELTDKTKGVGAMCFFQKYPHEYKQEVKNLTDELIKIGKTDDFLSERPGGQFDVNCRHIRAREIGTRLSEIGQTPLMESIVKTISKKCGKDIGGQLEFAWNGINGF